MAKFVLDTSSVEGVANSISELYSSSKEIADSINGYDTNNDDNFDFKSAKESIYTNVSAASAIIEETSDYITLAIDSHTSLQDAGGSDSWSDYAGSSSGGGGYSGSSSSGGSSGNGSNNMTSSSTSTTPELLTPTEIVTDPTSIASLIATGLITQITEEEIEESTKNKTMIIVKASKSDSKSAEYLSLVASIAATYNIPVAFIDLDKEATSDKTPITQLVKNGEVLVNEEGYLNKEELKSIFDNKSETNKTKTVSDKTKKLQEKLKSMLEEEIPSNKEASSQGTSTNEETNTSQEDVSNSEGTNQTTDETTEVLTDDSLETLSPLGNDEIVTQQFYTT